MLSAFVNFWIAGSVLMAQDIHGGTDYIIIEVEPGDSLWKIARKYLNDPTRWREFLKYNHIDNPNLIEPGMRLKVPVKLYKKAIGRIIRLYGTVEINKEGKWSKASLHEAVLEGDALRTAKESFAAIELFRRGFFEVFQNSYLVFSKFTTEARRIDAEIALKGGDVRFKLSGGEWKIYTDYGVIKVKGTDFRVKVEDGAMLIYLYEGELEIEDKEGNKIVIKTGEVVKLGENGVLWVKKIPEAPVDEDVKIRIGD